MWRSHNTVSFNMQYSNKNKVAQKDVGSIDRHFHWLMFPHRQKTKTWSVLPETPTASPFTVTPFMDLQSWIAHSCAWRGGLFGSKTPCKFVSSTHLDPVHHEVFRCSLDCFLCCFMLFLLLAHGHPDKYHPYKGWWILDYISFQSHSRASGLHSCFQSWITHFLRYFSLLGGFFKLLQTSADRPHTQRI